MLVRNNRNIPVRLLFWLATVLLLALTVHFEKISVQLLFLLLAAAALAILCFSRWVGSKWMRVLLICVGALLAFVLLLLYVAWPLAARNAAYSVPEVNRDGVFANRRVLLIVPHEDDEINVLSGVAEQYVAAGSELYVAFVTNGDSITSGETRLTEALRATALFGISEQNVLFLGYGDTGKEQTTHLYNDSPAELYRSSAGRTKTYGIPSHPAFRTSDYTRENLIFDLKSVLQTYLPDTIYCVDYDAHPDHRATSLVFEEALGKILRQRSDYTPQVFKGFAYSTAWQAPEDFYADYLLSTADPAQTPYMPEVPVYRWDERHRLPVAADDLSRLQYQTLTQRALLAHDSQNAVWQTGRVLNADKVFWPRFTTSVLYRAKISASSGDISTLNDFRLIDSNNVLSGDPPFENGWSPDAGDQAPTITIRLAKPTRIAELRLYDQPSLTDNIIDAQIVLDGKKTLQTGPWSVNGSATVVPVDSEGVISTIEIRVTDTEGERWGITELEAYAETPDTGIAFAKLTDENGNFLYDAWTDADGTLTLKAYRWPAAQEGFPASCDVSLSNPRCLLKRDGDTLLVFCPENESCQVCISDGEDSPYTDAIWVSNPAPGKRAAIHSLQWIEAHKLDPINQRAYYRTILGAVEDYIKQ